MDPLTFTTELSCTKSNCCLAELIAKSDGEIASLGLELLDSVSDAAVLASGFAVEDVQLADRLEEEGSESDGDDVASPVSPSPHGVRPKRKRRQSSDIGRLSPGPPPPPRQDLQFHGKAADVPIQGAPTALENERLRKMRRCQARKGKPGRVSSKRRALYRKANQIASDMTPSALPRSAQGYIGSTSDSEGSLADTQEPAQGPLPPEVEPMSQPRLVHLVRLGYRLVQASAGPTLFLDKENRVVGWRTGMIGGRGNIERWEKKTQDLTTALEELAGNMAKRQGQAPGVSRGEHSCAHWGYSYGGGQQAPTNRRQTKRERRWWRKFLQHPEYVDSTRNIVDSWKTWAPCIYDDYLGCHSDLVTRDPSLNLVYPSEKQEVLPFASVTANLGPRTICNRHRDIKNKAAGGLCAIKVLGPHDSSRGGHIVLHELGLVVEMRPGDVVFFPSAVISHETIPVSVEEKRYSLVWYSAGGLFRWRDANFQSLTSWQTEDPEAHHQHQQQGDVRWNEGWTQFSTLSELLARVTSPP